MIAVAARKTVAVMLATAIQIIAVVVTQTVIAAVVVAVAVVVAHVKKSLTNKTVKTLNSKYGVVLILGDLIHILVAR